MIFEENVFLSDSTRNYSGDFFFFIVYGFPGIGSNFLAYLSMLFKRYSLLFFNDSNTLGSLITLTGDVRNETPILQFL